MQRKRKFVFLASAFLLALSFANAANAADARKQFAFNAIDRNVQALTDISDSIYYFGELGMTPRFN